MCSAIMAQFLTRKSDVGDGVTYTVDDKSGFEKSGV
jgi:hypothetical protein